MEFFERMVQEQQKLRGQLASELQKAQSMGHIEEAARLRREVQLLDQDIVKLRKSIKDGVAFNIRASGLSAINLDSASDSVRETVEKMKSTG
jgi:ABC-type phosphate transport system ATPase subunit